MMALADDLERIALAAQSSGNLTGVLPVELVDGTRVYLCAYESGDWLALGDDEQPLTSRQRVHTAAALSALCEVAEEVVGDQSAIVPPPRLATNAYLDALGAAARRAEQAAGIRGPSPFGAAVESAFQAVEELASQVVARHLTPLT
jgi:hypothetical protein